MSINPLVKSLKKNIYLTKKTLSKDTQEKVKEKKYYAIFIKGKLNKERCSQLLANGHTNDPKLIDSSLIASCTGWLQIQGTLAQSRLGKLQV